MVKRETLQGVRDLLVMARDAGNEEEYVEACNDLVSKLAEGPTLRWLIGAIRIPRKRSSIVARSKRVENKVSRYLFGHLRTWKEREDVRDDTLKVVGEVKSVIPEQVFRRGGPWSILNEAYNQVREVVAATPALTGYTPFSVLVPVGVGLDRSLVLLGDGCVLSIGVLRDRIRAKEWP